MNRLLYFLGGLVLGGGIGSLSAIVLLKGKYEQIAQEQIQSVKNVYSKKNDGMKAETVIIDEHLEPEDDSEPADVIDSAKRYSELLQQNNYTQYSQPETNGVPVEEETLNTDIIYEIEDDEYGETDYNMMELDLYSNGILTDQNEELIEDPEDVIGAYLVHNANSFYKDTVFMRNEEFMSDYRVNIMREPYEY